MLINHISMVSWGSKGETLPPCMNLLTRVGFETWDPMYTGSMNNINITSYTYIEQYELLGGWSFPMTKITHFERGIK